MEGIRSAPSYLEQSATHINKPVSNLLTCHRTKTTELNSDSTNHLQRNDYMNYINS
jgi:hypothetical protein